MADDIEAELETQLASQREALAGIDEAIGPGGEEAAGHEGHAELLQLRDELRAAVSELESALLEIKRARILQQLAARNASPGGAPADTADLLPPAPPAHQAVLPATPSPHPTCQPPAGSCCSFRYMDGRWYAGRVQGPGRQAGTVSVTFEVPTRPFMLDLFDVMEALVRPHDGAAAARPASAAAAAAASAQVASRSGPSLQGLVSTAHGEVAVGRRALALLPGSRLYVPVEVVALDAVRATANVLPLLPQHDGRRGGGGGGGGGREVVVPLRFVTRHAHVTPPPSAAAAAGPGKGGSAGDGMESDGDGGGGSSTSSGSVSALLHPAIGEEDGEGSMDEDGHEDDDDGSDVDEDGAADDDVDEDLYGSDGDAGGSGGARRGGTAASSGAAGLGAGDEDEEEGGGLDVFGHARLAAAAGAVDDAALLAEWEAHGRGVASRLLVRMGYVRGHGLGSQGQGTMDAPEVLLLPERKGLGAADKDRVRRVGGSGSDKLKGGVAKKRSRRGGARQKRKRAIESSREAKAEAREAEEGGAAGGGGLFDFINSSLGDSSAAARIRKAQVSVAGVAAAGGGGGGGEAVRTAGAAAIAGAVAAASGSGPSRRAPDRRGLMTHHDNVAGIQTKLARLREMLGRHKDNRGLRSQIEAQIGAVQAELAAAQSAAARASKAIHDKDAQKKWLKF